MAVNVPITSVQLQKKKANAVTLPFKIVSIFIGVIGMTISTILCITLIGIPFGILCFIGSVGFIAAARGHQKVQCPHCGYNKSYVANNALNFKCRKCKNLTVIDWINVN